MRMHHDNNLKLKIFGDKNLKITKGLILTTKNLDWEYLAYFSTRVQEGGRDKVDELQ
jgi:hypothetical protein